MGADQLLGVQFVDTNTGWAVGTSDIYRTSTVVVKTTNGGVTWVPQTTGTAGTLYSVSFVDANTGWAAGSGGVVIKTTNGGASWVPESLATNGSLRGIQFINASIGYVAGPAGSVFKTLNGGTTWTLQSTGMTEDLNGLYFLNATTGWIVGSDGNARKTTDGGANWSPVSIPGTHYPLTSVYFIDANIGYFGGLGGKLVKSDGTEQITGVGSAIESIHFLDANNGWAVGVLGVIRRTSDGGTNWTTPSSSPVNTNSDWNAIAVVDANSVWMVGGGGNILRYWNHYPANPVYPNRTPVYGTGTTITPSTPAVTAGGTPITYSVTPSLPTGLTINTTTGTITGTPTTPTAAANYVISATNAYGVGKDTLNITVLQTPSNIVYSSNPAAYYVGTAISPNTHTVTGTVTRYSITPALPAGLVMDTISGTISGTPTSVSAAANYTVTAYNGPVSASTTVNIQVVSSPFGLSYGSNPAVYGINVAISPNNPTVSGSVPITYSVTPALPTGLTLNTGTGIISGTPTVGGSATNYTVTATNTYGSTTATLNITVLSAPSNLSYSANPAAYKVGTAIASNTPSVTGTVTHYAVNPALPSGLRIDTSTGVISGTPTLPVAAANYTVTASSVAGSTTATLNIVVRLAPTNLSYAVNPATYTAGTAITPNSPSVQGTAPLAYSVTPALPSGLALDPASGIISGTSAGSMTTTAYTITVSNPAGSATVTLNLTVNGSASISGFTLEHMNLNNGQSLQFTLPRRSHVEITLFDSRGKIQETLLDADREAGHYTLPLPKSDLHGPQYLLEFRAGEFHRTLQLNSSY